MPARVPAVRVIRQELREAALGELWSMKTNRVVLDANVQMSAALRSQERPRALVGIMRSENGVLLFSDETCEELLGVQEEVADV